MGRSHVTFVELESQFAPQLDGGGDELTAIANRAQLLAQFLGRDDVVPEGFETVRRRGTARGAPALRLRLPEQIVDPFVDRGIDAKNPRTAGREIPTGKVSLAAAVALTALSAAVFIAAAASLGRLCLLLSPIVLALVLGYSFTKRFTWLCHLFLGFAIGVAPAGAWIAVRGSLGAPAIWLVAAVTTWIGGFDILYALSDREFDRSAGIYSIPARFGVPAALAISALLHVGTAAALVATGLSAGLGAIYFGGVAAVIAIFLYEHAIVRPSDLSRLDVAFFNLNGYVSLVYFAATLAQVLVG